MPIYIANCTKQDLIHCFRVPESGRNQRVHIPSGQQSKIGDGWSQSQLEAVVKHMELFGFRNAADVSRKLSEFSGWLYSLNKPISESAIVTGHDELVDHQELRSATEASRSALAFDNSTREGKGRGKRTAKVTEVTVQQDIPAREKPTGKEVNFSLAVSEDGLSDFKLPV